MPATRRQFLTYLGFGTYSLLRARVSDAQSKFPLIPQRGKPPKFQPIRPSSADSLILPDGFRSDVICRWGDDLGSKGPNGPERFGFNNDFIAYFPIDALRGGKNSDEGLLFVNHEYPHGLFVSGYTGGQKTAKQIVEEKLSVGASVIHVKRDGGRWKHLPGSKYTRRFTALYPEIQMTGPTAELLPAGTGTLANCSGGRTPWMTALTCEENYHTYNGGGPVITGEGHRWADVPSHTIDEREYGWIVEIDPFGELSPLKHTALGRFAHENAAWRIGPTGKLVVYMGDDASDQYLYKYVSAESYRPNASRADNRKLLNVGTLYVANLATGRWLPLDLARNKALADAGFRTQSEVLLRCRDAAAAVRATPLDRPEDCEVHPLDGSLFVALTNNASHGNIYGHLLRLLEDKDNPEGESFRFEIFLAGGPQCGMACPDNLAFDSKANLWVVTDMSESAMNKGALEPMGNNGLFVVPTMGESAGQAFQFASGPVDSEMTGPWFNESEDTMFLAVQHPGSLTRSLTELRSHWPDGGNSIPRPSVVAIQGFK